MAIYREDLVAIELVSGSIFRSFLKHSIGLGDAAANRFGVKIYRNGAAESLSGVTCQGFFHNANGQNIALTSHGTVSGNIAYVTLPQACYNVEGRFTLAIKLVGGGVTGTMRIVDGVVDNTNTSSPVAPTGSVPTYQEVLSVFEQMQTTLSNYNAKVTEQDNKINLKADLSVIAPAFYNGTNYVIGQYVTYDEKFYRFTSDHPAGEWNSAHVSEVFVGPELEKIDNNWRADVSNLKEDLDDVEDWLGYPKNLFNARDLTVPNTNNWSIDFATKTNVTITHKNTFSTGFPIAILDLPSGDYIFHADYTNSATAFSLQTDGSWVKSLTDGAEFTVDSTKTNNIYFSNETPGTYIITDISVVAKKSSGKIPSLEDVTSINATKIADLKEDFNSIATPSIEPMDGTETQARAIRANGDIYTAGSSNYRISRFSVSPGKTYWITATTNWGNALWCYYDSNDSVVEVGTVSASGSDDTTIIDRETTAPVGSAFLVIAYNSTVKNGAVKTQTGYTLDAVWRGKKWVCVGDSLTAENIKTTKHYFDYVADATGITAVNMGYSGSGYARLANENHAFYQRISSCPTDADVVTIFGSFNDLGAGLPLGTVNDTGTDTLAGCINTTITNLQTVIPLVNLGIVAPTPWATAAPATSGEDFNYVEMIKAICAKRSIPYLDLWRESNLRPWDADFRALAYSKDDGNGTHPDENGHKLIAPRFKGFLETLLM